MRAAIASGSAEELPSLIGIHATFNDIDDKEQYDPSALGLTPMRMANNRARYCWIVRDQGNNIISKATRNN
jgi:hypothetical protein